MTTKRLAAFYGLPALEAEALARRIKRALARKTAFSLVRAGDIVARVLAHGVIDIPAPDLAEHKRAYAGLPSETTPQLRDRLAAALKQADVIGVTDFRNARPAHWMRELFARFGVRPWVIASALVMRELYRKGRLLEILAPYRIFLAGRSVPAAAAILRKKRRLTVAGFIEIDDYDQLERAERRIVNGKPFDALLAAAGVPARILCVRIARALNVTALDIGHVMDEIVHPGAIGNGKVRSRIIADWWEKRQRAGEP